MSEYPPPRQPSSVYNSLDYTTFGSGGSSNSLNFPLAQGTETMGFGVVWGDGSYQNSAATDICNNSFVSYPTAQGQVSFPAGIVINGQSQTTAYTGYPTSFTPTAPNSLTLDSHGKITQIDNVDTNLSYVLNRGNDAGTLGMTNLGGMTQFGAASNSLNYTEINTLFGASATPGLIVRDTNSQKQFNLLPNVTAGAYNPATEAGNIQILGFKGGSQNTETLELTTWSSTNSAIKVNPTSVEVGAGGTGVTGTSNILCDGTTVNISPSVTYPDTTVQNSAFTGAGSLAGSYTSADVTINSNGQITAISNGTGSAPNIVYSPWASSVNFASGFNSGTVVSVALTPGTWQLIGVLAVTIGGGASFNPSGNVSNPYALCSINQPGGGSIAIGTIASPSNGATWSGGSGQIYTYVQTVVTITSNSTYTLQYNVRVDLTTGYMSIPNISPPSYLRAIQLG